MEIKEGDEVKSDLDGEDFVIIKIANSMVVLKSKNGDKQLMTGIDSLKRSYRKKEVIPIGLLKKKGEMKT